MISCKDYIGALKIVEAYRMQKKKYATKTKFKIVPADIIAIWGGFSVPKILYLTDDQLTELQNSLMKISTCNYTNIEEYKHLTVAWSDKIITSEKDIQEICKIINKIIKNNAK